MTDNITLAGETNKNTKEFQQNQTQEIYIPPAKRQQIIDDLRLF